MSIIIYGGNLSPFVRKVLVLLAEKQVAYKLEPINPFAPPASFAEISPLKRIPAMRDTDLPEPNTLADSTIICDYLELKFPSPALYPADHFERARALWFEEYADSQMADLIVGKLFRERIVKPMLRQETDEAAYAAAKAEHLPPICAYLEKEIGDREFLVGDAFSIADISVASMLVNVLHADTDDPLDSRAAPKLAAYVQRTHSRPSFQTLIEKEMPIVKRFRGR